MPRLGLTEIKIVLVDLVGSVFFSQENWSTLDDTEVGNRISDEKLIEIYTKGFYHTTEFCLGFKLIDSSSIKHILGDAVKNNKRNFVDFIVNNIKISSYKNHETVYHCAVNNYPRTMKSILDIENVSISILNKSLLQASISGRQKMARILKKAGAEITHNDKEHLKI
ncbi:hypothetical protein AYI70_g7115 [Smittium culicis]|uniref:Uncharacterized protein n=1 Tax=Smittium culicis TaxID=133412 RepID=A0A1R1XLX2_9FUNG|nr:hypothetical protein AYI70_g7115 [Smittium culicis]